MIEIEVINTGYLLTQYGYDEEAEGYVETGKWHYPTVNDLHAALKLIFKPNLHEAH